MTNFFMIFVKKKIRIFVLIFKTPSSVQKLSWSEWKLNITYFDRWTQTWFWGCFLECHDAKPLCRHLDLLLRFVGTSSRSLVLKQTSWKFQKATFLTLCNLTNFILTKLLEIIQWRIGKRSNFYIKTNYESYHKIE